MTVIGVLGGGRRDEVTPWGAVVPGDGSATLDWFIAAEDRWHRPADEPSVRQQLVEGTPVVETRLRVPGGDVTHRVTAVPDHGGVTLVEITNDSPLPVAVALSRPDLWLVRRPTDVPDPGAELPAGSVVLPLGHRSTIRAALRHGGAPAGPLPADLPDLAAVVRGWTGSCERHGRVNLPDPTATQAWIAARCQAALGLDDDMARHPLTWLLGCVEAVRLGEPADRWLAEATGAVELVLRVQWRRRWRRTAPSGEVPWDVWRALVGAEFVARTAGDELAGADARALLGRVTAVGSLPHEAPHGVRGAGWFEHRLVRLRPDGTPELFPAGLPASWLGASLEVHELEVGCGRRLSFALRWHGERPALLWEMSGGAAGSPRAGSEVVLHGGGLDPTWQTDRAAGEALLAVPPGAPAVT